MTEDACTACGVSGVVDVAADTNGAVANGPVSVATTNTLSPRHHVITSPHVPKPFRRSNAPPPLVEVTLCDDVGSSDSGAITNGTLLAAKGRFAWLACACS